MTFWKSCLLGNAAGGIACFMWVVFHDFVARAKATGARSPSHSGAVPRQEREERKGTKLGSTGRRMRTQLVWNTTGDSRMRVPDGFDDQAVNTLRNRTGNSFGPRESRGELGRVLVPIGPGHGLHVVALRRGHHVGVEPPFGVVEDGIHRRSRRGAPAWCRCKRTRAMSRLRCWDG